MQVAKTLIEGLVSAVVCRPKMKTTVATSNVRTGQKSICTSVAEYMTKAVPAKRLTLKYLQISVNSSI